MKTYKSFFKIILFVLFNTCVFSNAKAQIDITYETEIFVCSPLGVFENASFNCSFNGTLSFEIIGDPDELLYIQLPVDVVDGDFSFLYTINAPTPNLIEVIWTIETSDDASGCAQVGASVSTFLPIDCKCAPVIRGFPIQDESCYQCADGSGQLLASGMEGPIVYEWSNGANTSIIENLAPGTYTLTVTGANEEPCTANGSITIDPYECTSTQIEYSSTQILCHGACEGAISIEGLESGDEIVDVLWSDGSTELSRDGLCAGFYSGTVTTADFCPYTIEVFIEEPDFLELEIKEITHVNGTEKGSITMDAFGGVAPYFFFINQDDVAIEHDSLSNEIMNLDPGCYDILVVDDNQCMVEIDSVCIDNISSVQSLENSSFGIYPNPCGSFLNVKMDSKYEINEIRIFNILGERQYCEHNEGLIEVDALKNGIYIIDIVTSEGHWIQQFVKRNDF